MSAPAWDLPALRELHLRMLQGIREQLLRSSTEEAAAVAGVQGGDVIYRIDQKGEELLVEFCEEQARRAPFLLIAEGVTESGERMFPAGADPAEARYRVIVDPIDGTRGLMYNKRSAWVLTGVAPDRGPETSLRDIERAMMTELPTTRGRYADQLWAERGRGASGITYDLAGDAPREAGRVVLAPSRATDLRHGFATLTKFFPGGKAETARLEEALFHELLGPPAGGIPQVFDDQYISNGGQLYELMTGHDRFTADLRPLILPRACAGEAAARLCPHPYDLCTELIAREAGVVVTGPHGGPLDAPLSVHHNVGWVGYANPALRSRIEPVLQRLLREFGFA
ncbi:MAG TPA: inositol monophosphatase [Armatimonadota bacterium]|nr:inositol monophosphatase [Armatimonadota bacterium]